MTSSLAHCLVLVAGLAAVARPLPPPTTPHVVATATTPITVEVVPDTFAPPTPDELEDFVARASQFVA